MGTKNERMKTGAAEVFAKVRPEVKNLTAAGLLEGLKFGIRVLFDKPVVPESAEEKSNAENAS